MSADWRRVLKRFVPKAICCSDGTLVLESGPRGNRYAQSAVTLQLRLVSIKSAFRRALLWVSDYFAVQPLVKPAEGQQVA